MAARLASARAADWGRLSNLLGVASVLLLIVSNVVQGLLPPADASAAAIWGFLAANHNRVMASLFLRLFAGFAFLWFLGTLRSALARAEAGTELLSSIAFGAGLVPLVFNAMATAELAAAVNLPATNASPEVAATLISLVQACYWISGVGLSGLLAAAFFVNLRRRIFPSWIAWSGLVVAAAGLVLPMVPGSAGLTLAAFLLSLKFGWIAAISIVLYRRPQLAGPIVRAELSQADLQPRVGGDQHVPRPAATRDHDLSR